MSRPAVWLWDSARAKALWANDAAMALWAARDLAGLSASVARGCVLSAAADVTLATSDGPRRGALDRVRAVLPDGRLGARFSFVEAPAELGAADLRSAAFDVAPTPMAVCDADGRVHARNAAFLDAFGDEQLARDGVRLDGAPAPWLRRDGRISRLEAAPLPQSGLYLLASVEEAEPRDPGIDQSALAKIAHDFRSPLTAVLGFAEHLRANLAMLPPERTLGYLDDMAVAAKRMRRLADDIVAMGATGAGLAQQECDLDAIAREALMLVERRAADAGAHVEKPPSTGLRAALDPEAFGRALGNLLDNAVKHGGRMLRLGLRDLGAGAGAEITVADDGPGLDREALTFALSEYGRPGAARLDESAGGLGLPIARDLVVAHGGRFEIDTAPGAGFRVRITLPENRLIRPRPAE